MKPLNSTACNNETTRWVIVISIMVISILVTVYVFMSFINDTKEAMWIDVVEVEQEVTNTQPSCNWLKEALTIEAEQRICTDLVRLPNGTIVGGCRFE